MDATLYSVAFLPFLVIPVALVALALGSIAGDLIGLIEKVRGN